MGVLGPLCQASPLIIVRGGPTLFSCHGFRELDVKLCLVNAVVGRQKHLLYKLVKPGRRIRDHGFYRHRNAFALADASGQIDEDDGVPCILESDKSSKEYRKNWAGHGSFEPGQTEKALTILAKIANEIIQQTAATVFIEDVERVRPWVTHLMFRW